MAAKECGHDDDEGTPLSKRILAAVAALVLLVLLVIFLVWLILRPCKPSFSIEDAELLNLTLSPPATLTTVMQVTVLSRNSNSRVGVLYQKLDAFVLYRGQQITLATLLPPRYLGHGEAAVWSPVLQGPAVPVSPYLAAAVDGDRAAGAIPVSVRVEGKLRWKVGTWVSGRYHLLVNCPAYLSSGGQNGAVVVVGPGKKFGMELHCRVEVWL